MSILLGGCQSIRTFMTVEHCECESSDLLVARDLFGDCRLLYELRGRCVGRREKMENEKDGEVWRVGCRQRGHSQGDMKCWNYTFQRHVPRLTQEP